MATYELWLCDPLGSRLKLLDKQEGFTATKITNNIGAITIALPSDYDNLIKLDSIIEVHRKPDGGTLNLFNAYQIRTWDYLDQNNIDKTIISGKDGVNLLDRRIVAYAAGSANTEMTDYADDMMKVIVNQNLGASATDTDRDLTDNGFTVDAELSDAPSITMNFAYRNVLNIIKDIAQSSRKAGTRLYFDMVPKVKSGGKLGWNFTTSIDQPGMDLTGTNQVIFGKQWGNLSGARIRFDHTNEVTVVYAGGQGLEADRTVEEREDTDRSVDSPYNRIEEFYNVSGQSETQAAVQAAGDGRLSELRPSSQFSGTLSDNLSVKFGVNWNFGDRVVVEYRGIQKDAVINSLKLLVNKDGQETITGGFEVL